jgi:hypothetical protein
VKPTFVQLIKIYAGINYSEMDQNTPIILDKENIPPDAHRNESHVGIGTKTTTGDALSVANGKYFIIILCKNSLVLISTIIYI